MVLDMDPYWLSDIPEDTAHAIDDVIRAGDERRAMSKLKVISGSLELPPNLIEHWDGSIYEALLKAGITALHDHTVTTVIACVTTAVRLSVGDDAMSRILNIIYNLLANNVLARQNLFMIELIVMHIYEDTRVGITCFNQLLRQQGRRDIDRAMILLDKLESTGHRVAVQHLSTLLTLCKVQTDVNMGENICRRLAARHLKPDLNAYTCMLVLYLNTNNYEDAKELLARAELMQWRPTQLTVDILKKELGKKGGTIRHEGDSELRRLRYIYEKIIEKVHRRCPHTQKRSQSRSIRSIRKRPRFAGE